MPDDVPYIACHLCGAPLKPGAHYVVRIDVYADPAMPEMSAEKLASTDLTAEMDALIGQMKHLSADDLMDDVHRRFEYRVCRACQRRVLANPIGLPRGRTESAN